MLPIIAQVRDRALSRVGILSEEDLAGLKLFPARNDVGTWELTLPHLVRADSDIGHWVKYPKTYGPWAEVRRNLLRNPSFENDLTGHRFYGLTGARVRDGATAGGYAVALTRTADVSTDAYVDITDTIEGGAGGTGATSLKPNTLYTFEATYTLTAPFESVPAGSTTGMTQILSVLFHLAGATQLTLQGVNVAGTRTLRGTFRTPASLAGYSSVRLYGGDVAGAPSRIRWDALALYEGAADDPYLDGDSITADDLRRTRWTGTPHASVSVLESRAVTSKPDEYVVESPAGSWVRHPLAEALAQPGAGIVVDLPGGRRFSGPVLTPSFTESTDDARGVWKFTGASDAVILADRLAFPDPAVEDPQASSASSAYDTQTGPAETLLYRYVGRNIGPQATTGRRDMRVTVGANLGRGTPRTKSARFANLLELCQELAITDGLLFDVVQVGAKLEFRVWRATDRSDEVRMDIEGDTLAQASYSYSGPRASHVIVMGGGEGSARAIRSRRSPSAGADVAAWGRVIEATVDARGTEEVGELDAKGDEVLAEAGAPITSLDVTPSDVNARSLGLAWWLGDIVTVNVAGVAVRAAVTRIRIDITPEGIFAGATVGDAVGFDPEKATAARVSGVESRVSALERSDGADDGGTPAGVILPYAGSKAPKGYLMADGAVYDPVRYPKLWDAIGTTYGGTASAPRLPDPRGRSIIGLDTSQAEFNVLGKVGGAKTHTLTAAQMPAHGHNFAGGNSFSWGPGGNVHVPINAVAGGGSNNYLHTSQHDFNKTTNAGGGQAHPILSPYAVFNYIIRA